MRLNKFILLQSILSSILCSAQSFPQYEKKQIEGYSDTVTVNGSVFVIHQMLSDVFSFRSIHDTIVGTDKAVHIPRIFSESHLNDDGTQLFPALGYFEPPFYSVRDYTDLHSLFDDCFSANEKELYTSEGVHIKALLLVDSIGKVIEVKQVIESDHASTKAFPLSPLARLDSVYRQAILYEDNNYCEQEEIPYDQAFLHIVFTYQGLSVFSSIREMSGLNFQHIPPFIKLRYYTPRPSNYPCNQ